MSENKWGIFLYPSGGDLAIVLKCQIGDIYETVCVYNGKHKEWKKVGFLDRVKLLTRSINLLVGKLKEKNVDLDMELETMINLNEIL